MLRRQVQLGRNGCALRPRADQSRVGAGAKRQAKRIEEDRLARSGLSSEHAKTSLEIELEPFHEHDIMDCKLPQHVRVIARPFRCARSLRRHLLAPVPPWG